MRDWWLRTVLVLQAPRAVFVALRRESPEEVSLRSEPVLLIVFLTGIAFVLSTGTAAHLMDDSDYDGLLVAVWSFLAGGLYGAVAYWGIGAVLYGSSKVLGSEGSFRRARHVLAFASVPVALSLVAWPVKLAVYGSAVFHRGGPDSGGGAEVFVALWIAACVWAAALLVIGVRSVHGWSWARAVGAAAVPLLVGALFAVL